MEIKQRLIKVFRSPWFWLGVITLAVLVIRLLIIKRPDVIVFDEYYYTMDGRNILNRTIELRREHPPLGELIFALGQRIFGDTPFGWRIFPVLFGTASIPLIFLICRQLKLSSRATVFATFLLAFENLFFVQSQIAMLDVYSVTFMLAAFLFYLRRDYLWCAVFIALSTLCKLIGAYAAIAIIMHWAIARRDRPKHFILAMVLAPLLFAELLIPCDYIITGKFIEPIGRIKTMLTTTASITMAYSQHPYESYPWQWVLKPLVMPYWYEPYYSGTISFTVWALIIPTVIYMIVRAKQGVDAGLFGVLWFTATYLVWIPLSLITDRVTYVFYFYPTVGAICLGLGMGLDQLVGVWERRRTWVGWLPLGAASLFLLLHLAVFVLLAPVLPKPAGFLRPYLIPTPKATSTTPTDTINESIPTVTIL